MDHFEQVLLNLSILRCGLLLLKSIVLGQKQLIILFLFFFLNLVWIIWSAWIVFQRLCQVPWFKPFQCVLELFAFGFFIFYRVFSGCEKHHQSECQLRKNIKNTSLMVSVVQIAHFCFFLPVGPHSIACGQSARSFRRRRLWGSRREILKRHFLLLAVCKKKNKKQNKNAKSHVVDGSPQHLNFCSRQYLLGVKHWVEYVTKRRAAAVLRAAPFFFRRQTISKF